MTTRKRTTLATAISSCLAMLVAASTARAQAPGPTAAEILKLVRYSQSAKAQDFDGEIRDRAVKLLKVVPLKLTLSDKEVRFVFYDGDNRRKKADQIIILSLLDNRYKLEEIREGKRAELPAERFAEKIRGTDITYEDLAMRFLYWPNPVLLGEDRAKGGTAWKIRCKNPVADGAYATVDVWVNQESGALMRMNGYDTAGKHVKSFEVDDVQRHEGAWILKKMIVRTHSGGKVKGNTYLSVDRPD